MMLTWPGGVADDLAVGTLIEDLLSTAEAEQVRPPRRQLAATLEMRELGLEQTADVAMREQAPDADSRISAPQQGNAGDRNVRLLVDVFRRPQRAVLIGPFRRRTRDLDRSIVGGRHGPRVQHRIVHRPQPTRARVEDQARTEPEIIVARQPHATAQEERHLLTARRIEPEIGPWQIGALDLESLDGEQLRRARLRNDLLDAAHDIDSSALLRRLRCPQRRAGKRKHQAERRCAQHDIASGNFPGRRREAKTSKAHAFLPAPPQRGRLAVFHRDFERRTTFRAEFILP